MEVDCLRDKVDTEPERLLLHVLRDELDLTGTKRWCSP
jgi:aerobic-type carbon monoxide dehydrogenase small subunit (CoxS/CutS family)